MSLSSLLELTVRRAPQLAWQSESYARLRAAVAPFHIPVIASELGWSTCSIVAQPADPAVCAGYPGSEDTLSDQASYLARQWLLSSLDGAPCSFVYQWADGDMNPVNRSDHRPEARNTTDGGDNFGLNWRLGGPPKPALAAATFFQTAVGRRDLVGRVSAHSPGPRDAEFTFVLGFGESRPRGKFARVKARPQMAKAFAVWSLRMEGAVAELVGTGSNTACPGELDQPILPVPVTASACGAACRDMPRCRSFVVRPAASGRISCTLHGSRCLAPGNSNCAPPHTQCAQAAAYTLRQRAPQAVDFAVGVPAPTRAPQCFASFDVYGNSGPQRCTDPTTGLLHIEATEAPLYLLPETRA